MRQVKSTLFNRSLSSGTYVVAVSGGVDSMALLDILRRQAGLKLVVAHMDHGVRADSAEDRRLVQATARQYGLPFVYHEARLGSGVSEAAARAARYAFLRQVRQSSGARAIITAHHQDDALETAIINLLRGTGRKGLTSLASRHDLERPLLEVPKQVIVAYAQAQGLRWREDSTNQDETYLRNHVRRHVLPRLGADGRTRLLQLINNTRVTNDEIDTLLVNYLHFQTKSDRLDRQTFDQLSHAEAREVLAGWLRAHHVRSFDRKALERLVVAAKVAAPGAAFDVCQGVKLTIDRHHLALAMPER